MLKFIVIIVIVLGPLSQPHLAYSESTDPCDRIVSLAPSITELLFALDLGNKIVGDTKYCRYPEAAQKITKIGGFLDPNYEVIASLKPTLILTLAEQEDSKQYLQRLGLNTVRIDHRSVAGILDSISKVGALCKIESKSSKLAEDINSRVNAVKLHSLRTQNVRVLIAIGGNAQDGVLSNLFISGRDGYYDVLLKIAGGTNVYTGQTISLPSISEEGIIALNPDVIIQIGSKDDGVKVDAVEIKKAWEKLTSVSAVQFNRIYVFNDDFASIPGPRFVELLEKMARTLHPDPS